MSGAFHQGRPGSKYFYERGCRCSECRADARAAHQRYRERARNLRTSSYLRELETSRARKRRRTGTCERCGGVTRYNGHSDPVSRVCKSCNSAAAGARMRERAGTIGRTAEFIAFLAVPRRFSEFRDHFHISSDYASEALHRMARYGYVRHVEHGVWEAT